MTLIVVDRERMTADNYATVNSVHSVKVLDGFPKLFSLPFRINNDGILCYPRLAFSGDANAFCDFFVWLNEQAGDSTEIPIARLRNAEQFRKSSKVFQIIIPFLGGAVTVDYGMRHPHVEVFMGRTLGFGGDYLPKVAVSSEYRNWETIFRECIVGGWLPGNGYHYLEHSTELAVVEPTQGHLEATFLKTQAT